MAYLVSFPSFVENRNFVMPQLHSTPALGEFSSEYCHKAMLHRPMF